MKRFTINQLAEITGKAPRTVKKRLVGLEPLQTKGRVSYYNPVNALTALFAPDVVIVEHRPAYDIDWDYERSRETKERADNLELKNAQMRRELIPVELMSWTLGNLGSQISAILESIPVKLKRRMPKLGAAEVDIIKGEIAKCQNLASKVSVDFDEYENQ